MLIDKPGTMTGFQKIDYGQLFLTFLDKDTKVVGMKAKTWTGIDVVFHLHDGAPRIVAPNLFLNRDVLALEDVAIRLPNVALAKGENPGERAYGSAILSAEGVFIRASHREGPFDVSVNDGAAISSRNHPGSIWFESWDLVRTKQGMQEVLITHNKAA
jgi:hypothetical protein